MSFFSQLIGGLAALGIKKVDTSKLLPSGAVQHFAMNTAPTGWLVCDGSAVSRTTYADLFAAIGGTFGIGDGSTTFNVPNLGGQFVRSWIADQAVDPGRLFGSSQSDDTEDLYAQITVNAVANMPIMRRITTPSWTATQQGDAVGAGSSASGTLGTAVEPLGTGETRPVNVALLACIKT